MQTEVSHLCRQAAAAASDTAPSSPAEALAVAEVELAASLVGTRAFLTQNKDAEAFQMAQQCLEVARKSFTAAGSEDQRWQGLVLSHAIAALAQHAAGDVDAAAESFDEVMAIADHADARNSPAPRPRDHMIAEALKQVAAFRLAQRKPEEAAALAGRAAEAATKATASALAEGGPAGTDPMLSPTLSGEAVVDCRLLQAQALIDGKDWEGAEARLAEALTAAEALASAAGGTHARVAIVLLPLAWIYSRTGRVTLAEGLYREISKILQLNPAAPDPGAGAATVEDLGEVHPSLGALAAWRYAQLLTALPRRGTEAAGWHRLAKDLYDDAPLRRVLEPASVFGTLDALQGKGAGGYGVVLDLMARRALPRAPPPPVEAAERKE